MKPKVFIGSSSEGLPVSHAIQSNLLNFAEVTVWDQGVFTPSSLAIESLCGYADVSDFAIFVFSPDDILKIRGEYNSAVRDNVIFELGLFIGKIGQNRCFIVAPSKLNEFRIPTDLLGITLAIYEGDRSDGNLRAATGPASTDIKLEAISKLPFNVLVPLSYKVT